MTFVKKLGLSDICEEAKDVEFVTTIRDKVYKIVLYLGGH